MEETVLAEYFELLKFETVGADPSQLRACVACATWLKRWLAKLGFSGELLYPNLAGMDAPPPPPVLFAERAGDEGAPTLLFYGHYDVQPADPLGEWKTRKF